MQVQGTNLAQDKQTTKKKNVYQERHVQRSHPTDNDQPT